MNRDDVIRMALESGFAYRPTDDHLVVEEVHGYSEVVVTAGLERFAALVADAARGDYHEGWEEGYKAGVIAEREECADAHQGKEGTMNLREAAEKALETLDYYRSTDPKWHVSDETTYQELKTALAEADDRKCTCHPDDNPPKPCPRQFALTECRQVAALAEADEPVAYLDEGLGAFYWPTEYEKLPHMDFVPLYTHPSVQVETTSAMCPTVELYTSTLSEEEMLRLSKTPGQVQIMPHREPLTEEEVRRLYREAWTPESEADEVLAFARAVERAHGIGGDE